MGYIAFTARAAGSILNRKEFYSLEYEQTQRLLEGYLGLMELDKNKLELGQITAYDTGSGIWILDREDLGHYTKNHKLDSPNNSIIIRDTELLSGFEDEEILVTIANILRMELALTKTHTLLPYMSVSGNDITLGDKKSDPGEVKTKKESSMIKMKRVEYGNNCDMYLVTDIINKGVHGEVSGDKGLKLDYCRQYGLLEGMVRDGLRVNDNIKMEYSLEYSNFIGKLTERQKLALDNGNDSTVHVSMDSPLRISGAAGTGKTTVMLLKAYKMLVDARNNNQELRLLFISHNSSTYKASRKMFEKLANGEFKDVYGRQYIKFSCVMQACLDLINQRAGIVSPVKLLNDDESESRKMELGFIKKAYESMNKKLMALYKTRISPLLLEALETTHVEILISLFKQEFDIQISGHSNGELEGYVKLGPLKYGLPISNERDLVGGLKHSDKYFVYSLYNEYNKLLESESSYSISDIAIEAYGQLRGPIWNRERELYGYDYVFVDEVHMLNYYEQLVIESMLRKSRSKNIICTMDYGQAFGDQGEVALSYLESTLLKGCRNIEFDCVMRSTAEIGKLCSDIIQSGLRHYGNDFTNSYYHTQLKDTGKDVKGIPNLILCNNQSGVKAALKDELRTQGGLDNTLIIVLNNSSFSVMDIQRMVIEGMDSGFNQDGNDNNIKVKVASQYEINGIEFGHVIIVGADGSLDGSGNGSVKSQAIRNCLLYTSHNILYLACSRAMRRLTLIGDSSYGYPECFKMAVENGDLNIAYKS